MGAAEGSLVVYLDAEDTAIPPLASRVGGPLVIDATPPPQPSIESPSDGAVIPVEVVYVSGSAPLDGDLDALAGYEYADERVWLNSSPAVTIAYKYDDLYRLVEADCSTGEKFEYQYTQM